jgi:hypothetical protein
MYSKFAGLAAGAAVALATLGCSAAADAAIINIDSKTAGTTYTFDAGSYLIQWIGVADGGAFDAWNPSCPTGDCATGWRDVFATTTDSGPTPDFTAYAVGGGTFSSALASLAAFKAAPNVFANDFHWNGSSYQIVGTDTIAQPWIVNIQAPVTVSFYIPDGTRGDNYGGVSLRVSAVPEPATWTMMILGFGGVGLVLRRRRRLAAA